MSSEPVYVFLSCLRDMTFYYSLLSASTGSFLLAELAGIKPAMKDRKTLMMISMSPAIQGRLATFGTSKSA